MSTLKFNQWLNSDNTENYKCRAWVNFNGTGTVAIRASGNVSSITDNGSGDYTINFTNAMTDTNYCLAVTAQFGSGGSGFGYGLKSRGASDATDRTTTACRTGIGWMGSQSPTFDDALNVYFAVFR